MTPGRASLTNRSWLPPPMLTHPSLCSRAMILRVLVSSFGTSCFPSQCLLLCALKATINRDSVQIYIGAPASRPCV